MAAEFVLDVFGTAKQKGLFTGMHTNGTCSLDLVDKFFLVCDYFVVDIKAYTQESFHKITGNSYNVMQPRLVAEKLFNSGANLEIVTPVIPGFNDSIFEMRSIARWIHYNLSSEVTWHLVPFVPTPYLFAIPAPSRDLMEKIRDIGVSESIKRVVLHF